MTRRVLVRTLVLSAMLAATSGLPARPASAFHQATVHVEATAWFPNLEAEARSSEFGVAGSLVTSDDLGIEDPDVVLQRGGHVPDRRSATRSGSTAFGFSVDGSNRIDRTFTFDGERLPGRDLGHLRGRRRCSSARSTATTWFTRSGRPRADPRGPVRLGQGLDRGAAPRSGGQGGVPGSAAGRGAGLRPASLPGAPVLVARPDRQLSGGTIGEQGSFIDADGGIEWLPIPILALRVGYRYFHGEGEDGGDEAKIDLSGPYASLTFTF